MSHIYNCVVRFINGWTDYNDLFHLQFRSTLSLRYVTLNVCRRGCMTLLYPEYYYSLKHDFRPTGFSITVVERHFLLVYISRSQSKQENGE